MHCLQNSNLLVPFLHQASQGQELPLLGTLFAFDFPVEARRDLLRQKFGANILTVRLANASRRVPAEPK